MNWRKEEGAKPATITTFRDRRYGFLTAGIRHQASCKAAVQRRGKEV
jgi:hypothetical protein